MYVGCDRALDKGMRVRLSKCMVDSNVNKRNVS